jgi:hypothetical protein
MQPVPNRAIRRQYFVAAYRLLGRTGMDNRTPLDFPGCLKIAPVSGGRVRLLAVAEAHPGPLASAVYGPSEHTWPCARIALAGLLVEFRGRGLHTVGSDSPTG